MAKTYNTFTNVSTGDVYTAASHNAILQNIAGYRVPPMCSVYINANETYTNNAAISWDAEVWDTDAMWTSGSSLSVTTPGIYIATLNGRINGSTGFNVVGAAIRINSSDVASSYSALYSGATISRFGVSSLLQLANGDTVDARISCDGGGTLTLYGSATTQGIDTTRLSLAWLGQVS